MAESEALVRTPFDQFAGSELARAQRVRRTRRMDASRNPSLSASNPKTWQSPRLGGFFMAESGVSVRTPFDKLRSRALPAYPTSLWVSAASRRAAGKCSVHFLHTVHISAHNRVLKAISTLFASIPSVRQSLGVRAFIYVDKQGNSDHRRIRL